MEKCRMYRRTFTHKGLVDGRCPGGGRLSRVCQETRKPARGGPRAASNSRHCAPACRQLSSQLAAGRKRVQAVCILLDANCHWRSSSSNARPDAALMWRFSTSFMVKLSQRLDAARPPVIASAVRGGHCLQPALLVQSHAESVDRDLVWTQLRGSHGLSRLPVRDAEICWARTRRWLTCGLDAYH